MSIVGQADREISNMGHIREEEEADCTENDSGGVSMVSGLDLVFSTIRSNKPVAVAVQMLCRARRYAQRAQCSPWHFAIELEEFSKAGISKVDLRWLLSTSLVEHAQEVVDFSAPARKFKRLPSHVVTADACFVLSDSGFTQLSQFSSRAVATQIEPPNNSVAESYSTRKIQHQVSNGAPLPQWDAFQKRLSFNQAVVKQFVCPAPNQEAVLSAFQEESWPYRVDDPLVPILEQDARQRLKDTIRYLNQRMKTPLLHFRGDGTGTGIVWQVRE